MKFHVKEDSLNDVVFANACYALFVCLCVCEKESMWPASIRLQNTIIKQRVTTIKYVTKRERGKER